MVLVRVGRGTGEEIPGVVCAEHDRPAIPDHPANGGAGPLSPPGFPLPGGLAESVPGEVEVKAAFLLNFIKFVEWPDSAFGSPEDPYLVSMVGNDSIEEALKGISGKTVSGRRVVVRKVPGLSSLDRCHILFVGESERGKVDQVLGAVKKWPVLTVADIEGFARRGGTIGFIREEK